MSHEAIVSRDLSKSIVDTQQSIRVGEQNGVWIIRIPLGGEYLKHGSAVFVGRRVVGMTFNFTESTVSGRD